VTIGDEECPLGAGSGFSQPMQDQFGERIVSSTGSLRLVCAPIERCEGTFGACSTKPCASGKACVNRGLGICECVDDMCTPPTGCGDTSYPTCNGACPAGSVCNALDSSSAGTICACQQVATACNASTATCSNGQCGSFLTAPGTCTLSGGGACVCVY